MSARVNVILSIFLLISAGLTVASASEETLRLDALCYPQLGHCGVAPPCGPFVPLGGRVGVELRALHLGDPAPLVEVSDGETPMLTDDSGRVRFTIEPQTGFTTSRFTAASSGAFVDVPLTWTSVSVLLESAPATAVVGQTAEAIFRVLATATGEPIANASLALRTADGASLGAPPTDQDGRTVVNLTWRHEYSERFRVSSISACGLPAAVLPEPFDLEWATSETTRLAPTLKVLASGWQAHALVSYQVQGGESPIRVEYRIQPKGAWSDAPILIPEGEYLVDVRAVDARNRSTMVVGTRVGVDEVSPTWALVGDSNNPCGQMEVVITDATSGLVRSSSRVLVDSRDVTGSGGRFPVNLAHGEHNLDVRGADHAGNVLEAKSKLWCDRAPPTAVPLFTGWSKCEMGAWKVADSGSSVDASTLIVTRAGAPVGATMSNDIIKLQFAEGVHTYRIALRDHAGNALTRDDEFSCDRQAPTLGLSRSGSSVGRFATGNVDVKATSADNASGVARVEMRVDGGEWRAVDRVELSGEGTRLVEARATDRVGLTTMKSLAVDVDTEPPVVTAPASVDWGQDVNIRFRDSGSGVASIRISGPANVTLEPAPASSVRVLASALSEGRWFVVARDAAGHERAVVFSVGAPPVRVEVVDEGANQTEESAEVTPAPTESAEPEEKTNTTQSEPKVEPEPQAEVAPEVEIEEPPVETPVAPEVYQLGVVAATRTQVFEAQPVSATGRVTGVERGVLILRASTGVEHEIAPLQFAGGSFRASGPAPAPGTYTMLVRLYVADAPAFDHEVTQIEVMAEPVVGVQGSAPVPAFPVLALVAMLGALALAWPRRPKP